MGLNPGALQGRGVGGCRGGFSWQALEGDQQPQTHGQPGHVTPRCLAGALSVAAPCGGGLVPPPRASPRLKRDSGARSRTAGEPRTRASRGRTDALRPLHPAPALLTARACAGRGDTLCQPLCPPQKWGAPPPGLQPHDGAHSSRGCWDEPCPQLRGLPASSGSPDTPTPHPARTLGPTSPRLPRMSPASRHGCHLSTQRSPEAPAADRPPPTRTGTPRPAPLRPQWHPAAWHCVGHQFNVLCLGVHGGLPPRPSFVPLPEWPPAARPWGSSGRSP